MPSVQRSSVLKSRQWLDLRPRCPLRLSRSPRWISGSAARASPRMRPLAPGDSASDVISRQQEQQQLLLQPQPAEVPLPPQLQPLPANKDAILMVYKGPSNGASPPRLPQAASATAAAADRASLPRAVQPAVMIESTSIRAAGVGVARNGTVTAVSNGRTRVSSTVPQPQQRFSPPATGMQSAASAQGSRGFRRSMMVAGFESDTLPEIPLDDKYAWAQESYSKQRRAVDTWSFVLTLRARLFLLDKPWTYPGGMTDEKRLARTRTLAAWVRERLLQLGPTFIKLGQLFSTRSDLFPMEFTEELSKLQDRVPAFGASKVQAIVQRELGAPPGVLFREFDPRPIAAASLGQVHLARLHSGEQVVVKVQRPGLKQLFDIDLENLRQVAEQLDRQDESGRRDFVAIYQECATILYKEIDYINEGRNADRFRRNFSGKPWVQVPRIYWQYSSPSVLALEYLPGIKVTNIAQLVAAGVDAKAVAQRATEAYLIQILKQGFFHADPHPGNIAVAADGSLIFYDFGMLGEIVPATRERLLELFYGIAKKDVDQVVRCLVALGIIVPTSDTLSVKRAIAFFLETINRQAEAKEAVATIGEDLFAIALDQPFRFPATFTFVLRAFATLEGIGKALDPGFSFAAVAAPYARELLDLQDAQARQGFLLEQLQKQATEMGQAAAAVPLRVARMESTLAQLESGDLKLRVRVLEAERTARRAGVMQVATINSIACLGLLNVGTQLGLAGQGAAAGGVLALSAVFAGFVLYGFKRVQRLDKFERDMKR